MMIPLALFAGAVLGLALARVARARNAQRRRRVYAIGLLVAALLYAAFAVAGGAGADWITLESLGVVLYGAAAWIGLRPGSRMLAFGWIGHVVWDVGLHVDGPGAVYTPEWYPWLCVSLDLVVAAAAWDEPRRAG